MSVDRRRMSVNENGNEERRVGSNYDIRINKRIKVFCNEADSVVKKLSFTKAVHYKCLRFNNCYEPYEVISEAYIIAIEQIKQGQIIPKPEAWLRVTIWNLLRNKSRKVQRDTRKKLSIESKLNNFQKNSLSLQEMIAALPDSYDFYYHYELREEQKEKNRAYQRIKSTLKLLKEDERRLVNLKYVQNLSWEEVAAKIGFSGRISSLRKKSERLRKKMQKLYNANTGEEKNTGE